MKTTTTIGFIGAGKMGQALMQGLLARGLSRRRLVAADAHAATRAAVSRRLRITTLSDNRAVVRRSGILILAVKPQQFPEVLAAIAPTVTSRHLVISIAAGVTLRWLKNRLPKARLVRVMPNLPATVQRGFSALTFGARATARDRHLAREIFEAVGEVCELPERHFDAITAVSGSGPAYVFFLVQAWQQAAARLGLPRDVAARAIMATLQGAEALIAGSGEDAATLIARVASKKGTTEAALKVLARRQVAAHFIEALQAAAARSRALSWS